MPVDGDAGTAPQFAGVVVPDGLPVVVVAVQTQRLAQPGVAGFVAGVARHDDAVVAVGVVAAAWQGRGRQSQARRLAQVCLLTTRVWTGPNPGAVKVANTVGWWRDLSGTPLPPTRPARMSW